MKVSPVHSFRSVRHTCHDGIERTFFPVAWPDVMPVAGLLAKFDRRCAWMEFVVGSDAGTACMIDVAALMLDDRYCDMPLSRQDIEHGDYLDSIDLEALAAIAVDMAGLKETEAKPAEADSFDLDCCVFFVMRSAGLSWDEVHALTFDQLMWLYRQAVLYRLKYELPLHGVDTKAEVARMESEEKQQGIEGKDAAPPVIRPLSGEGRPLGKDEAKNLMAQCAAASRQRVPMPLGTVDSLRSLAAKIN